MERGSGVIYSTQRIREIKVFPDCFTAVTFWGTNTRAHISAQRCLKVSHWGETDTHTPAALHTFTQTQSNLTPCTLLLAGGYKLTTRRQMPRNVPTQQNNSNIKIRKYRHTLALCIYRISDDRWCWRFSYTQPHFGIILIPRHTVYWTIGVGRGMRSLSVLRVLDVMPATRLNTFGTCSSLPARELSFPG